MASRSAAASKPPVWISAWAAAQRPTGPLRGLQRQRRRALEERRRRGQAATRLSPVRRAFQFRGDVLVGPTSGLGPMPGAPFGIEPRIGDLRERRMTSCRSCAEADP